MLFNPEKVLKYTFDFAKKRVLVIGAGAVGSHIVENLVKMGIKYITIIDFDRLEEGNISKSSSLYRYPDDLGKNKALALAKRTNELIGKETVHGVDANITLFGPNFFLGFDAIFAPLDNYAAKVYVNQQWLQIPSEKRPVLIYGGTYEEGAQGNCLDGKDVCLRCLVPEAAMANSKVRFSCTGPHYRVEGEEAEIVRTTGLASSISANIMCEQLRAVFLGIGEVYNKSVFYHPFPVMDLKMVSPMKKRHCPDCERYFPPENTVALKNSNVFTLTIEELFHRLDEILYTKEYSVKIPRIEFANAVYDELIVKDYCRSCNIELTDYYRHEFHTSYEDLLCEKCKAEGRNASTESATTHIGETIKVISRANCNESLKNKTLYSLGWPLGGFVEVCIRDEEALDIMDEYFEKIHFFYCEDDGKQLNKIEKLEG